MARCTLPSNSYQVSSVLGHKRFENALSGIQCADGGALVEGFRRALGAEETDTPANPPRVKPQVTHLWGRGRAD